jgi:hypothetical protein
VISLGNEALPLIIFMVVITQFSQKVDSCGFASDRISFGTRLMQTVRILGPVINYGLAQVQKAVNIAGR